MASSSSQADASIDHLGSATVCMYVCMYIYIYIHTNGSLGSYLAIYHLVKSFWRDVARAVQLKIKLPTLFWGSLFNPQNFRIICSVSHKPLPIIKAAKDEFPRTKQALVVTPSAIRMLLGCYWSVWGHNEASIRVTSMAQ